MDEVGRYENLGILTSSSMSYQMICSVVIFLAISALEEAFALFRRGRPYTLLLWLRFGGTCGGPCLRSRQHVAIVKFFKRLRRVEALVC